MPEFPSDQDPFDPELYPEVILPDNGPKSSESDDSASQPVAAPDTVQADDGKTNRPIRFKKPSEAIPFDAPRIERHRNGKSRSGKSSRESRDFFADDQSISELRNRLYKPVIAVVGILSFLGIVYLFNLGLSKNNNNVATNQPSVNATADANVRQPGTLDEAYQRLNDKMQQAKDLLDDAHDRSSLDYSAELKLSALIDWNVLDLTGGHQNVEMNNELVRATRRYIGNKNSAINRQAQNGLMLLQIGEYLKTPDQEFWPEIANRFEDLLKSESEYPRNSRNFLVVANALADRGLSNESQQLYSLISENFSGNEIADIASLGRMAGEKIQADRPGERALAMNAAAGDQVEMPEQVDPIAASVDEESGEVATVGFDSESETTSDEISIASQVTQTNDIAKTGTSAELSQNLESAVAQTSEAELSKIEDSFNEPNNEVDGLQLAASETAAPTLNTEKEPTVAQPEFSSTEETEVADIRSEVDLEPAEQPIEVVATEDQGDQVVLPTELAPSKVPDELSVNAGEIAISLSPAMIEPAPEPDEQIEESNEVTNEPVLELVEVDRGNNRIAVSRSAPLEPESKIEEFLTDRDASAAETNVVFDDVIEAETELKSETQSEPGLQLNAAISLAQNDADSSFENEQDPTSFRDPPEAAPAVPRSQLDSSVKRQPQVSAIAIDKFEEYRNRVRAEVGSNNVSAATLNSAIEFSDYLIERNLVSSAKRLLNEISNAVYMVDDSTERSQIRDNYYSSKKRSDYFGNTFVYGGLYDVNGDAIRQNETNRELKLVVFWSIKSQISGQLIEQIERLKQDFSSRRVKVIAVCQVSDIESQDEFRRIAKGNQSIEFYQLKANDRASKLFAERFPVRKYPYLLMLSADNKVVGINVDPVFFDPVGR